MIKESGRLTYKCNSLGKGDIGGGIDVVIERDRGIGPMLGGVFKTVDLTHGELCVIAVANATVFSITQAFMSTSAAKC